MSRARLGIYHYDPYDFSDTDSSEDERGDREEDEIDYKGEFVECMTVSTLRASRASSVTSAGPSFPSFTRNRTSSVTSYTRTSRSRSPTILSTPEASLGDQADEVQLFKEEHGRLLSDAPGNFYGFPVDLTERGRLDRQHQLLLRISQGKYPPPMEGVMESGIRWEKSVLDLGSGCGAWVLDVAQDFPQCTVGGVDLVPGRNANHLPQNAWARAGNINSGISQYGEHDVVHARLISAGISDYRLLIDRIAHVLKPGGLIEVVETDFRVYNKDGGFLEGLGGESLWWTRFMGHVREAIRSTGGDVDAATHLKEWVTNQGAFENVSHRHFWCPITRGDDIGEDEGMDASARSIALDFLGSSHPLLLANGMSEKQFEILEANVMKELYDSNSKVTQLVWATSVFATKRLDAPPAADV